MNLILHINGWPGSGKLTIARKRQSRLVPVTLACELEENIRRLTAAGRADLLKLTNSDVLRNVRANYPLYRPADLRCIKLGVSAMSAQEGAAALYGCITRAVARPSAPGK